MGALDDILEAQKAVNTTFDYDGYEQSLIQQKTDKLNQRTQDKLERIAPENQYKAENLISVIDGDSYSIEGVTGRKGLGGDKTGNPTDDRLVGMDTFEVPHPGFDSYRHSKSGEAKFNKQKALLGQWIMKDPENRMSSLGVDQARVQQMIDNPSTVTDDDIYKAGTYQQLTALYNLVPNEGKTDWTPGPLDSVKEDTPIVTGTKENPLNIPVKRYDTGKTGYYGRPLTDVLSANGKSIAQELGYTQGGNTDTVDPIKTTLLEDIVGGIGYAADRGLNSAAIAASTFTSGLGGVADFGAEVIQKIGNVTGVDALKSDGEGIWKDGELGQKTDKLFGYDDKYVQQDVKEIKEAWANGKKTGNWWDLAKAFLHSAITPEIYGQAAGFIGSLYAPGAALGKIKTAVQVSRMLKSGEAANKVEALAKIEKATENAGRVTKIMDNLVKVQPGAIGYAQNYLGDSRIEYKKLYGKEMSSEHQAATFMMGMLSANLEYWIDSGLLKGKSLVSDTFKKAFQSSTKEVQKATVDSVYKRAGKEIGRLFESVMTEAVQEPIQGVVEGYGVDMGEKSLGQSMSDRVEDRVVDSVMGAAGGGQMRAASSSYNITKNKLSKLNNNPDNTNKPKVSTINKEDVAKYHKEINDVYDNKDTYTVGLPKAVAAYKKLQAGLDESPENVTKLAEHKQKIQEMAADVREKLNKTNYSAEAGKILSAADGDGKAVLNALIDNTDILDNAEDGKATRELTKIGHKLGLRDYQINNAVKSNYNITKLSKTDPELSSILTKALDGDAQSIQKMNTESTKLVAAVADFKTIKSKMKDEVDRVVNLQEGDTFKHKLNGMLTKLKDGATATELGLEPIKVGDKTYSALEYLAYTKAGMTPAEGSAYREYKTNLDKLEAIAEVDNANNTKLKSNDKIVKTLRDEGSKAGKSIEFRQSTKKANLKKAEQEYRKVSKELKKTKGLTDKAKAELQAKQEKLKTKVSKLKFSTKKTDYWGSSERGDVGIKQKIKEQNSIIKSANIAIEAREGMDIPTTNQEEAISKAKQTKKKLNAEFNRYKQTQDKIIDAEELDAPEELLKSMIDDSMSQAMDKSMSDAIDKSMSKAVDKSMSQAIDKSMMEDLSNILHEELDNIESVLAEPDMSEDAVNDVKKKMHKLNTDIMKVNIGDGEKVVANHLQEAADTEVKTYDTKIKELAEQVKDKEVVTGTKHHIQGLRQEAKNLMEAKKGLAKDSDEYNDIKDAQEELYQKVDSIMEFYGIERTPDMMNGDEVKLSKLVDVLISKQDEISAAIEDKKKKLKGTVDVDKRIGELLDKAAGSTPGPFSTDAKVGKMVVKVVAGSNALQRQGDGALLANIDLKSEDNKVFAKLDAEAKAMLEKQIGLNEGPNKFSKLLTPNEDGSKRSMNTVKLSDPGLLSILGIANDSNEVEIPQGVSLVLDGVLESIMNKHSGKLLMNKDDEKRKIIKAVAGPGDIANSVYTTLKDGVLMNVLVEEMGTNALKALGVGFRPDIREQDAAAIKMTMGYKVLQLGIAKGYFYDPANSPKGVNTKISLNDLGWPDANKNATMALVKLAAPTMKGRQKLVKRNSGNREALAALVDTTDSTRAFSYAPYTAKSDEKVKNSNVDARISNSQYKANKKTRQTPSALDIPSMEWMLELEKEDPKKFRKDYLGIQKVDEDNMQIDEVESIESSNLAAETAWDELVKLYKDITENGRPNRFYFSTFTAVTNRTHELTNTLTPQTNSLHRNMINYGNGSYMKIDYTDNTTTQFKRAAKAVAQSAGQGIDKGFDHIHTAVGEIILSYTPEELDVYDKAMKAAHEGNLDSIDTNEFGNTGLVINDGKLELDIAKALETRPKAKDEFTKEVNRLADIDKKISEAYKSRGKDNVRWDQFKAYDGSDTASNYIYEAMSKPVELEIEHISHFVNTLTSLKQLSKSNMKRRSSKMFIEVDGTTNGAAYNSTQKVNNMDKTDLENVEVAQMNMLKAGIILQDIIPEALQGETPATVMRMLGVDDLYVTLGGKAKVSASEMVPKEIQDIVTTMGASEGLIPELTKSVRRLLAKPSVMETNYGALVLTVIKSLGKDLLYGKNANGKIHDKPLFAELMKSSKAVGEVTKDNYDEKLEELKQHKLLSVFMALVVKNTSEDKTNQIANINRLLKLLSGNNLKSVTLGQLMKAAYINNDSGRYIVRDKLFKEPKDKTMFASVDMSIFPLATRKDRHKFDKITLEDYFSSMLSEVYSESIVNSLYETFGAYFDTNRVLKNNVAAIGALWKANVEDIISNVIEGQNGDITLNQKKEVVKKLLKAGYGPYINAAGKGAVVSAVDTESSRVVDNEESTSKVSANATTAKGGVTLNAKSKSYTIDQNAAVVLMTQSMDAEGMAKTIGSLTDIDISNIFDAVITDAAHIGEATVNMNKNFSDITLHYNMLEESLKALQNIVAKSSADIITKANGMLIDGKTFNEVKLPKQRVPMQEWVDATLNSTIPEQASLETIEDVYNDSIDYIAKNNEIRKQLIADKDIMYGQFILDKEATYTVNKENTAKGNFGESGVLDKDYNDLVNESAVNIKIDKVMYSTEREQVDELLKEEVGLLTKEIENVLTIVNNATAGDLKSIYNVAKEVMKWKLHIDENGEYSDKLDTDTLINKIFTPNGSLSDLLNIIPINSKNANKQRLANLLKEVANRASLYLADSELRSKEPSDSINSKLAIINKVNNVQTKVCS